MVDVTVLGLVLDPTKIEQGAQRAGRAVDDLTAKTDRAARSTDDLQGATGGAGQTFGELGPRVERSSQSVEKMGLVAQTVTSRLLALTKASVGIFAFDVAAKVGGFTSAMDLLQKASDAAASAIQRALGIDRVLARMEQERAAVEANAAAWRDLAKARQEAEGRARGPGVAVPSIDIELTRREWRRSLLPGRFPAGNLTTPDRFISTEGLSASDEAELLRRTEELRRLAEQLKVEAERRLDALTRTGIGVYSPTESREAVVADVQARLTAAFDRIEMFADGLRELNAATQVETENKKAMAAFEREALPIRKLELDVLKQINDRRRAQLAGPPRLPGRSDALDLTLLPLPTTDFDALLQQQIAQSDRRGLAGYDNFATPGYRSPSGPSDFEKRAQTEQIAEELRRVEDAARAVQRVYDDLGQIGSNAFESFITGAQDARDAVKMLGQDIYLYLVRALITLPLQRALSSGLSSLFPGLGAPLAQFQHGGTVYQPSIVMPLSGGRPTLIAEAGPEEIVPSYGSGRGRAGRGGVTIVVNPQPGDTTWRRSLRQVMHDAKRGGIT